MVRSFGILLATAVLGLTGFGSEPMAQGVGLQHPASGYYRSGTRQRSVRGPQVRGFAQRRVGGYSYFRSDTINTYGNVRSKFGGSNVYRDAMQDRQTSFGPFDHGFFFDSGVTARGGYSPYQN